MRPWWRSSPATATSARWRSASPAAVSALQFFARTARLSAARTDIGCRRAAQIGGAEWVLILVRAPPCRIATASPPVRSCTYTDCMRRYPLSVDPSATKSDGRRTQCTAVKDAVNEGHRRQAIHLRKPIPLQTLDRARVSLPSQRAERATDAARICAKSGHRRRGVRLARQLAGPCTVHSTANNNTRRP